LVTLGSASSQWACPGIAPCFTPTKPLVRLQPTSPGDPDPEVTALGRELKEAAFPLDTLESFIPRVPSDTPSDEIKPGTTGEVSFACKERGKSSTGIKVETVQDDDESSERVIPSTPPSSSIKSISPIASDQGTVDPLKTPKLETQGPLKDLLATRQRGNTRTSRMANPVTQDDWIDLIRLDPKGFRVLVALMATSSSSCCGSTMTDSLPIEQCRHSLATRVHQRHYNRGHHPHGGTQGVHPKTLAAPMTNVTVEMVNNFLDRVCSKCKDLAIYRTEIIQILTTDGDQHNLLVDYNDIKLSDVCHTICTLHQIKDNNTELD
jgi:hypothetical protein